MKPKVVVIGGGTGTYTVLSGLKNYDLDITAIVSMADSGGTAKIERDEFGMLPNSDIRKALLALSQTENSDIIRQLFSYRFYKGVGISGISFGNFFLAALTDILGDQVDAVGMAGKILNTKGRVLPISTQPTNLLATYEGGTKILGEHYIDEPLKNGKKRIVNLELIPEVNIYPLARKAIIDADLIVIGPGDLYTSIIANLIVGGVKEAICKSQAVKVYIVNLISKFGETYKYTAQDHVRDLEGYLGKNILNFVAVNSSPLPSKIIKKYKEENGYPVKDDLKGGTYKVLRGDFLAEGVVARDKGDTLKRSLVRHDPEKLAKVLVKLLD
ncbi:YvcK family protein [Candidatus Parcubacteria bacterium]|nr:YvcK family protein [Patescibacteria group bacterium]MBU4380605.1 YvcK family protein [Patescibacteria group bacterium]MCG2689533.1 YvcK family protein [Candidatus Parcubacteria bacterium]